MQAVRDPGNLGTIIRIADWYGITKIICSPTTTHSDLIARAAAAGKHIFCEKPVSLDLAKVDEAHQRLVAARAGRRGRACRGPHGLAVRGMTANRGSR